MTVWKKNTEPNPESPQNEGICYPAILGDIFLMVLFPPIWVLIKELKSEYPLKNIMRIVLNFLLTSCFYFPGLIHAMSIYKLEGTI
jgi:uncharacterized membrane protein YqaE (UPF0057 family)